MRGHSGVFGEWVAMGACAQADITADLFGWMNMYEKNFVYIDRRRAPPVMDVLHGWTYIALWTDNASSHARGTHLGWERFASQAAYDNLHFTPSGLQL